MAGSCPASHPPAAPGPSPQGCSRSVHPPGCADMGVAPTQVQNFAFGVIEPYGFPMVPLTELAQIPVDGIISLRCGNCTTQLGVTGKFAGGVLYQFTYVIDEDVK
ncbi:hypothetical protein HGM15179_000534 [Zosterops borbonicus]|uniref:Uncharacterized protein n=1 Tax=Zosterops borbonicus TaxID=364589 RepID=A0A8K1GYA5_9PASS|nr:hypothetical protein HGM15179_000534 [Zosterops borbonicus]